jgi:hypothetical protein
MRQLKLQLLTDKLFLLGLIILLTNDFIFKYEVGGLITGKLSDISGLFIFPFFWSILFERHRLNIYILTTLAFILWKLPLSTDIINIMNQVVGTSFYRVIDYSDLLTIVAIPFSYRYLNDRIKNFQQQKQYLTTSPILISLVSLFAFVATTLPRQEVKQKLTINEKLLCNLGKGEIFKSRIKAGRGLSDKFENNLSDTSFRISFHANKFDARVETWVRIYSLDSSKTAFEIDSLDSYVITGGLFTGVDEDDIEDVMNIKRDEFIKLFKENVIERIENKSITETDIYFDNPKLDHTLFDR